MKDTFYDLLNRARADLAEAKQALEAAKRDAQHYAPDDPDPYGPDAAALQDTLERAQRRYAELARRRRALLGQKPELTEGRLARLGLARLQEMRHWHRFRGQARALLADLGMGDKLHRFFSMLKLQKMGQCRLKFSHIHITYGQANRQGFIRGK